MSECSNCHINLGIESIGYQEFTYSGKRKDGSGDYSIKKLIPFCLRCGESTAKFDKQYAKEK